MIVSFNSAHDTDTDVILLTTAQDGSVAEFHVHKSILSEASSFFETMFSLPQLRQDTNKPVIPIPEPAHILKRVLQDVYRIPTQPVSNLDELTALLTVATKYDLTPVVESLRALLVSPEFLSADPLHVYSIACRFDLNQEAALASKWTLNVDFLDDDDDDQSHTWHNPSPPRHYLRYISAYDYHRLLVLHHKRVKAADALLQAPYNIKCMHCSGSVFTMHSPPKWWQEWVVGARKELRKRPLETEKIFGVDYIFQAATKTGCVGCAESVLNSWTALIEMKERVDQLPTTI